MVLDLDLPGGFFFSPWLTGTGAYLQPLCLCFSDEGLCVWRGRQVKKAELEQWSTFSSFFSSK